MADEFDKWFPGLERSKTECNNPKLRILCFPNAGSAEDLYTSERRAASPLLEWCRRNNAELLAVQLPGRMSRLDEKPFTDAKEVAEVLLPVVGPKLSETPYVIVAHSVGTWLAEELLQLLRSRDYPMPISAYFSAFPSPDIPHVDRPWRVNSELVENQFIQECRRWGISEVVFSRDMWPTYKPILRADFTLFDAYEYTHDDKKPFDFPITAFYGTSDSMITKKMVEGWEAHTNKSYELISIEGNHLFPLDKKGKETWLQIIANELEKLESQDSGEKIEESEEEFQKWFPGLEKSQTKCENPALRILCFPNAGNNEDFYSSDGPLLDWCRRNNAELLSLQLPGRMDRLDEKPFTDAKEVAKALLPVLAPKLSKAPYVVVAHSVGTWLAEELLQLLRSQDHPMPAAAFLSAFPSPDIPHFERPWQVNGDLVSDIQFIQECCRWGFSNDLFSMDKWRANKPILRADFTIFDTYKYTHDGKEPFDFPVTAYYGTYDNMITKSMVNGWKKHTRATYELISIDGNNLFPLDKTGKETWLRSIVDRVGKI